MLATFDGPARAGLQAGEIELRGGDESVLAVHTGDLSEGLQPLPIAPILGPCRVAPAVNPSYFRRP
jgi:hypothetical protein